MSIEKDLSRIADAVEAILGIMKPVSLARPIGTPITATEVAQAVAAEKNIPVKAAEKVVSVAPEVPAEDTKQYTEDEARTAIIDFIGKVNAKRNGQDGKSEAIKLLVKYGANADRTLVKDAKDFGGLVRELAAYV